MGAHLHNKSNNNNNTRPKASSKQSFDGKTVVQYIACTSAKVRADDGAKGDDDEKREARAATAWPRENYDPSSYYNTTGIIVSYHSRI